MIGGSEYPVDAMAAQLSITGEEAISTYDGPELRLRGVTHPHATGPDRAVTAEGDALVWVWGNVVGAIGGEEAEDGGQSICGANLTSTHRPRPAGESGAAFCARLYAAYGRSFAARLNGDFVGVVLDRTARTVSVFTDRLGSWPVYYTRGEDGTVVFSSQVQSLDWHPSVTLAFDKEYVVQHLSSLGGPFGVKTPFQAVESFAPGTVTTFDLSDLSVEQDRYWKPRFPTTEEGGFEGYDAFVDAFVERYRASMADRTRDRSKRYGVLLSGGSDARLVLGALPDDLDVVAFHMSEWMSKEARIAERVAHEAGVEFRWLRRDEDYFARVLEQSPRYWNFEQLFNQAWAEGFADEIRAEVDVLFTGHFSDTMFKGLFVPVEHIDLGRLGRHRTSSELVIESVGEFYRKLGPRKPRFVDSPVDLETVVRKNVQVELDGCVESYGVEFDSMRDLALGRLHLPATTDPFFRQSLREHVELQMPLYDTRLLDLWARMPTPYKLRHNVINDAVARIAPTLADMPHADSGVPLRYGPLVHRLGTYPMNALRRLSPFEAVPASHLSQQPWGDHAEILREHPFAGEALHEAEAVVKTLPFLDWDTVLSYYDSHLDGRDHTKLLYRLLTFLKAPVTGRIAARANEERVRSARLN